MTQYLITRKIGIDAGHRIMAHSSKCRHIHGHRYEIEATCRAHRLHESGEQTGMVLDFAFLKDEMMQVIDTPCDHGFIAQLADGEVLEMFCPPETDFMSWLGDLNEEIQQSGFALTENTRLGTKLYVVPFTPTAEELAHHWYERLAPAVKNRSDGIAELARLRVWETPNNWAEAGEPAE